MKKKITEEFIKQARKIHGNKYDYSKVNYVDAITRIIIICPRHGEFIKFPNNHLGGGGCKKCNNKRGNTEEFVKKAKKVHNGRYDYSKVEYKNNSTKIIIICSIHGEFLQRPYHHLKGHGCRSCANEFTSKLFRLSKDEFIDKSNKIHGNKYDYSKVNYINYRKKVIIICPKHGEFLQTPTTHSRSGCVKCVNERMTKDQDKLIKEFRKVHNDKFDYSKVDYINSYTKITIICPRHGEFKQNPANHLGGHGCLKCVNEDQSLGTNIFIKRARKIHGNKYNYDKVKYTNASTKIIITCPEDGDFLQIPINHLGGSGCRKCSIRNSRSNTKEFIEKARKIHGDKYNYDKVKYKNNCTKIIIICPKHGEFKQIPNNHLNGGGCGYCTNNISKISQLWLDDCGVSEEFREKIIRSCNQKYIVDAFDPINNIIYEFNGDFFHGNPNMFNPNDINPITKTTFMELYKKTLEKEQNLMNDGYDVISIWESEFKG